MKKILTLLSICLILLGCKEKLNLADLNIAEDGVYALMTTSEGDIVIQLEYQRTPVTVASFVGLAEGTIKAATRNSEKYFDGLKFHRVVKGFVIQGGDPNGDGTGGPGYSFPDEIVAGLSHDRAGILSMANSGPDTNGSQFFITLAPTPSLDGNYTVFGHVVKGEDVVLRIGAEDSQGKAPEDLVTINSVEIIRVGSAATKYKPDQVFFDAELKKLAESRRIKDLEAQKKAQEDFNIAVDLAKSKWSLPAVLEDESGIEYSIINTGTGPKATEDSIVNASYGIYIVQEGEIITLNNSFETNEAFPFAVNSLPEGWKTTFLDMNTGERRVVIIPYDLAYGKNTTLGIPGYSTIICEFEIISIEG